MMRIKYKTVTEGAGAGVLESIVGVTLADGRTVKVFLDPHNLEFAIMDKNALQSSKVIIKTGSGKNLNAIKRAARQALVELGAPMENEKRSSTKQVITQAAAVVKDTTVGKTGSDGVS